MLSIIVADSIAGRYANLALFSKAKKIAGCKYNALLHAKVENEPSDAKRANLMYTELTRKQFLHYTAATAALTAFQSAEAPLVVMTPLYFFDDGTMEARPKP